MKTYSIHIDGSISEQYTDTVVAYERYAHLKATRGGKDTIELIWDPTGEVVACSDDWDDYDRNYAPTKEDMEEMIL